MAGRDATFPQRLRPHPRGVRGEAQGADHRDKNRTGRAEATKGGGDAAATGAREGQEERREESEEGEKE